MRLFGTSGIRAVVDSWLIQLALKVGLAVGRLYGNIVVGCDTRTSSSAMKQAVIAGLLAAGAKSRDAGVLPTPTLALATRGFDAAVMITASHNPPEYNGMKLLNPDGSAFNRYQQQQIEEMVSGDSLAVTSWDGFQSGGVYRGAVERHIRHILGNFPGEFKLRVVLDCGGGAASVITPQLLKRMGCEVIALSCDPSGFSPRAVEPAEANLAELMKVTLESGADLGIAHDGDGDRMMVVDERGRFVSGDKLLVLLAHELGAREVVTTIDASMAVDEAGFGVTRTGVGDNNVSQELKKGGDFGGEPSGSWVFPKSSLCPDGIYAAAQMVSITSRQRISHLVDEITGYPLMRGSANSDGVAVPDLERKLVAAMKPSSVSRVDGIRLNLQDGWLLIRASGTEPKIRVTAEAKTEARVRQLYDFGIRQIKGESREG
ncbi:MAG: phosphoglucosamine mutase [Dehalococcoidales bacterium]